MKKEIEFVNFSKCYESCGGYCCDSFKNANFKFLKGSFVALPLLEKEFNEYKKSGGIIGLEEAKITEEFKLKNGSKKDYSICGALCTANDVLVRRKTLQNPQIGDLIVFENAGAYSVSDGISLFLSHTLPRILLLQKNKEMIIARDFKETFWLNFALPIDEK